MKNLFFLLFLLFSISNLRASTEEMLVVFTQVSDQHFNKTTLPKIRAYALEKGIELIEKEPEDGVPENITTTPSIIYQNAKGRSIYASRYAEFSTIKNFIRTSRVVPQKQLQLAKEAVLLWETGKTKVVADLKITDIKGKQTSALTSSQFESLVRQSLSDNMQYFKTRSEVSMRRTDRLFYLDIHPYLSEQEIIYLSLEIYSQYSCKDPIFSNFSAPLEGRIEELEKLLKQAAEQLEQLVLQQMKTSMIGDAFSAIPSTAPVKSWAALGLELPTVSEENSTTFVDAPDLPQKWTFHKALEADIPIVQFRFMAPLDRYIGEIRKIEGDLYWKENTQQLQGNFKADMQSLTMGMESFDYNVLNKYVKAYKFPASSFKFDEPVDLTSLSYGETTNIQVDGTFELMRKKRPVKVIAQLRPIVDEFGNPLLQVSASFELNIVDDFKMKGPDGPEQARKTMLFDLNFLMKAAGKSAY
ncbi:MAG: YceI family protein [Bacteroidota bacterium]